MARKKEQASTQSDDTAAAANAGAHKKTLIGSTLGQYRLDQMLASGGMARIYKATDTNLERTVAVKILMRELIEMDETLTERFEREAKAVAALEHDNIVRVYDYRKHDDVYYIVMNFIDGIDLADELNRLRREGKLMEVDRALRILGQVASALDFAHAAGIIHRDVKPSNILIDKNDKAILTDFGLVLRQSKDKTLGTAFGTPRYISPEQALASEKSVPQSDIYSLAVVVYEILTGDMLFKADTPMQIALSHISEPPPRPRTINPNIPESVEREILKALEKDPLKRHRSAMEFIQALRAAYRADQPEALRGNSQARDSQTLIFPDSNPFREQLKTTSDKSTQSAAKPAHKTDEWTLSSVQDFAASPRDLKIGSWSDGDSALKSSVNQDHEQAVVEAGDKPAAPKASLAAVAGVAAILAVAVIALVLSGALGGGNGGSNQALISAADGVPLSVTFNSTTLVIRNPGKADVDVSTLTFGVKGITADQRITGSTVRRGMLPAGNCVSLVQSGRAYDAREWDCGGGRDYARVDVPGQRLFWRTVQPTSFEVYAGEQLIATCVTVRRDGSGTCDFNLPKSAATAKTDNG